MDVAKIQFLEFHFYLAKLCCHVSLAVHVGLSISLVLYRECAESKLM